MQIQHPNNWAMLCPKNLKQSFLQFPSFFLHSLEGGTKKLSQFAIQPITFHSSSADSKTACSVAKYAVICNPFLSQT